MFLCYTRPMKKLLLIEDDIKIGGLLQEYMDEVSYSLIHFTDPRDGLRVLKKESFDAVILDVMLPGMNGFDVCKEIRGFSNIPIIMLTARGDVTDRIIGLELGADDYLSKPFSPRELVARIEAITRRSRNKSNSSLGKWTGQGLELNFIQFSSKLDGEEIKLTTMEFELLKVFIRNENVALTRDDIMNELQGIESDIYSRSIDIAVSRLRQKIKDKGEASRFIKTIWGSGYMFIATKDDL